MLEHFLKLELMADVAASLASVAVTVDCLETLANRREYAVGGVYNYEVLRTTHGWMMKGARASVLDPLFRYPNYLGLMGVQLLAAVLLLSHVVPTLAPAFIAIILACRLMSHLRNQLGLDGSDQMLVVVFGGLAVFHAVPEPLAKAGALSFIALQSLLSYFAAGYAKLVSPVWRGGDAIGGILNTTTYGSAFFSRLLLGNRPLSLLVCWSVLIFECVLPLLVFFGVKSALVFVVVGAAFHVSVAAMMGLNSFVWAFSATYPCLLFLSAWLATHLGGLD
jgi:hypothetical protein